jgi:transposase
MARKDCPGWRTLRRRVAELEALVRDLQARLGQHAGNSSLPPSASPPAAPKPVAKEPSGRSPGAQAGHAHYRPATCRGCGRALAAEPGPHDPEPTWHQVAELPEIAAVVTEHRSYTSTCPHCGARTHAPIPAEVRAHALGPRLTAVMAYLSGARHDSKRGVEEVVETVFDVPVALGTVVAVEQEASAALAPAHAEVAAHVRAAPVKHVDETGWKQTGRLC